MTRPLEWVKPLHGTWHLIRPEGVSPRVFCGRRFVVEATRYRSAPRVHLETRTLSTNDGMWPDASCWSCMDAYVPWAVRNGLTAELAPKYRPDVAAR